MWKPCVIFLEGAGFLVQNIFFVITSSFCGDGNFFVLVVVVVVEGMEGWGGGLTNERPGM